jgi:hypothetical protein
VEDTLNALLDEEADRLSNARRYERTGTRKDTRAGFYNRNLLTKAGNVKLKVPKLRTLPFETTIIHRYLLLPLHNVRTPLYDAIFRPKQYQRKEINVKEAMVEM